MKKLLANGCSHMAGSECVTNVADIFALNLDMETDNISTPGGGNHRILRSTIEYIEENGKPDFVLIGWTTQERFEFSWRGQRANYTLDKHSDDIDLEKFQPLDIPLPIYQDPMEPKVPPAPIQGATQSQMGLGSAIPGAALGGITVGLGVGAATAGKAWAGALAGGPLGLIAGLGAFALGLF